MISKKLRLAVIGTGHLGNIHTRLAQTIDDVHLVGVVDPLPEARQKMIEQYGVAAFEDHRQLIGQIDAAIIAANTEHHYWIGMELAEAGVHLLLEKPITQTTAEADALVRAAAQRNLILQVGHVERFNPAFTAVADQIQHPRYIETVRASGYTCRSVNVGVVLDLMIHDIDLVLSLVDSEIISVEAVGTAVFGPHEDMAHARLKFANGTIANLNASRTSFQPQRTMHIYADNGFAGIDFATATTRIVRPSEKIRRREFDVTNLTAEEKQYIQDKLFTEILPMEEVQVEKRNAILDEQHDFVISIRSGQRPQVSGEDGRDALQVAEHVLEAIKQHQQYIRRPAARLRRKAG